MERILIGMAILCACAAAWAEDCHVIVKQGTLAKRIVEGREVYVVAVADVKPDQCFKPVETAQKIRDLQQQVSDTVRLAEAYKQNLEAQKQQNDEYRQLIQRHEQALNQSITLSQGFDGNLQKYNQLAKDYDQLTVRFDDLAGKYRDVALTGGSPITFEMGGGMTSRGDAIGVLGAGLNVYKTWDLKAWGVVHKDFSAMLIGASFRF